MIPRKRLLDTGVILAGATLLLNGCAEPNDPPPTEETARPSVLMVSVDCMRADHVGAYGYERDTTPAIDGVAEDGLLFDAAYAQCNWTKPSVASLMTGLYVRNHGVTVGSGWIDPDGKSHGTKKASIPLPADIPLMAEGFAGSGYRTAGFVENSHIAPNQGFGRGYENYERRKPAAIRMLEWIDGLEPGERFFGYVHLIGPHDPYDGSLPKKFTKKYRTLFGEYPTKIDWTKKDYRKADIEFSEGDLQQARALYDAELRWFDSEQIEPLVSGLKKRGFYDDLVLVITSDHGEELYDHGDWAHGKSYYEELDRVPLIIKMPSNTKSVQAGSVVHEVTEQIDLFPTLQDLAGIESPEGIDGSSFASLLRGDRTENPEAYAVTEFAHSIPTDVLGAAIVRGSHKYMIRYEIPHAGRVHGYTRLPESALYEIRGDGESSVDDPDLAARLHALLIETVGESPRITRKPITAVQYTEEQIEELRALGYVE